MGASKVDNVLVLAALMLSIVTLIVAKLQGVVSELSDTTPSRHFRVAVLHESRNSRQALGLEITSTLKPSSVTAFAVQDPLATKVRIAQTSGKEVWFLDAVYAPRTRIETFSSRAELITATLAVICATCRRGLKETSC